MNMTRASFGVFLGIPSEEICEIAARSGLDFCVLDGEHGRIGDQQVYPLLNAAKAANPLFKVFYRLPGHLESSVTHSLDTGVDGILIPQVTSRHQVEEIVKHAKFAPLGSRGVHPAVRAAHYGLMPGEMYLQTTNQNNLIIAQIEGEAAIAELDDIMACPGLDGIFIGPYDLSQSLGIPGQVDHPSVKAILRNVAAKATAAGMICGTFAGSKQAQEDALAAGYGMLGVSIDTLLIARAMRDLATVVRKTE